MPADSNNHMNAVQRLNELGQPIGTELPGWKPPPLPPRKPMEGRFCRLEPLDPKLHAADLFHASARDEKGAMWTYLPYGPFATAGQLRKVLTESFTGNDPLMFTVVEAGSGRAVGVASYLRIIPASGSIEVGHIVYSPLLQRVPAATEAMYLMMKQAFALGYRRYEWKCDALNAASRSAAQRLGFSYEGLFRQATVYKGRNRDTAWYSVIDSEWSLLEAAFKRWLDPVNFDECGHQRLRLSELTAPLLQSRG